MFPTFTHQRVNINHQLAEGDNDKVADESACMCTWLLIGRKLQHIPEALFSLSGKINLTFTFQTFAHWKKKNFSYFSVSSSRLISSALQSLSLNNCLSGRCCFGCDIRRSSKHSTSAHRCRSLVSIRSDRNKKKDTAESIVSLFLFGNKRAEWQDLPRGRNIHQAAGGERGREREAARGEVRNQDSGWKRTETEVKRAVGPPLRVPAERASAELHSRPPSPWRQLFPAAAAQRSPEPLGGNTKPARSRKRV